ncbi:MAG TPA: pantetheine-phosphate adenylyltransferase [Vicinamibacterales bacterium]|nr:pantetheine-phosphate adenylyltransferase [Vicinamibacterales bacterium]
MAQTSRLAVVPGSFDPPTNGHLDMIARAATLFDRVVVALLVNASKQPIFTLDERVAMMREIVAAIPNVEVDTFDGLLADYVRMRGASAVVRGLRTTTEYSEEWPMAQMNRHLNPACETIFLVPAPEHMPISARLVREIASLGGPLAGLVPPSVEAQLTRRFAAGARPR